MVIAWLFLDILVVNSISKEEPGSCFACSLSIATIVIAIGTICLLYSTLILESI